MINASVIKNKHIILNKIKVNVRMIIIAAPSLRLGLKGIEFK